MNLNANNAIQCILVDDEPLSQDVLIKYVNDCPALELAGVASNAFEANELIKTQKVQLIFLDINMPKLSGINFVKSLSNPPLIVFTTAYPEYALDGFDLDAVDYLLKPISFERFLKSVDKVSNKLLYERNATPSSDVTPKFIVVKADKKIYQIDYEDINYIEGCGDYIKINLSERLLVVNETLKSILARLPEEKFLRIHKSYIIAVKKLDYIEGNRIRINEQFIPIGLKYKDNLSDYFKV